MKASRNELPALFVARGYREVAEIGVRRGDFSNVILAGWTGRLYMIDAWVHQKWYTDIANVTDEDHEANLRAAEAVLAAHGGRGAIIRGLSTVVASGFVDGSLDAVYIDADHSQAAVLADLTAWAPKVRSGGVIAGHDYLDGVLPEGVFGVKSAVLEFFGHEPDIVTAERWPSWLVEVP